MKCIKNVDGIIKRVADTTAEERVATGKYTYCSKNEWKEKTRGPVKNTKVVEEPVAS